MYDGVAIRKTLDLLPDAHKFLNDVSIDIKRRIKSLILEVGVSALILLVNLYLKLY